MNIDLLNNKLKGLEAEDILKTIASENNYNIVFTTSFGIEDQVITDMICKHNLNIQIVSLDTGRLFSETYKVHNLSLEKYKKEIKVYYPQTQAIEDLVTKKGPYSFYESIENRKECCNIRKVEPLRRALKGKDI